MKNKTEWVVLGLSDSIKEVDFGSFKTKKEAVKCIFKNIKKFPEYGMGLIENPYLRSQWNYTTDENGSVWSRLNQHDLW